jgi:hypothetical protein
MLWPMVSRSVCLGVKPPSGAQDQVYVTVRQSRIWWCGVPSSLLARTAYRIPLPTVTSLLHVLCYLVIALLLLSVTQPLPSNGGVSGSQILTLGKYVTIFTILFIPPDTFHFPLTSLHAPTVINFMLWIQSILISDCLIEIVYSFVTTCMKYNFSICLWNKHFAMH